MVQHEQRGLTTQGPELDKCNVKLTGIHIVNANLITLKRFNPCPLELKKNITYTSVQPVIPNFRMPRTIMFMPAVDRTFLVHRSSHNIFVGKQI